MSPRQQRTIGIPTFPRSDILLFKPLSTLLTYFSCWQRSYCRPSFHVLPEHLCMDCCILWTGIYKGAASSLWVLFIVNNTLAMYTINLGTGSVSIYFYPRLLPKASTTLPPAVRSAAVSVTKVSNVAHKSFNALLSTLWVKLDCNGRMSRASVPQICLNACAM